MLKAQCPTHASMATEQNFQPRAGPVPPAIAVFTTRVQQCFCLCNAASVLFRGLVPSPQPGSSPPQPSLTFSGPFSGDERQQVTATMLPGCGSPPREDWAGLVAVGLSDEAGWAGLKGVWLWGAGNSQEPRGTRWDLSLPWSWGSQTPAQSRLSCN